jgi:hypothetical protein
MTTNATHPIADNDRVAADETGRRRSMFVPLNSADEPLSPIARCYQIAAARGRALRLAREQAATLVDTNVPVANQTAPHPAQPRTPDNIAGE